MQSLILTFTTFLLALSLNANASLTVQSLIKECSQAAGIECKEFKVLVYSDPSHNGYSVEFENPTAEQLYGLPVSAATGTDIIDLERQLNKRSMQLGRNIVSVVGYYRTVGGFMSRGTRTLAIYGFEIKLR